MIREKQADVEIDAISRWKVGAVAAVSGVVMCAGFWAMQQSAHAPMIDLAARIEATKTFASIEAVSGRSMSDVAARALGPQLPAGGGLGSEDTSAKAPEIASGALASWRSQRDGATQNVGFKAEPTRVSPPRASSI